MSVMLAALIHHASVAYSPIGNSKIPDFEADHKYGKGFAEVPADLAKRRLPFKPDGRLPMEEPRFVARDETELLTSIFTWWELLDGIMMHHEPKSRFMGGYIREIQLRRMLKLIRPSNVSHYCEVGMNGGHSVVAMLLGNPRLKVHVFDLMRWNYSQPVAMLLKATFRERFELHEGFSFDTLPPWLKSQESAGRNGVKCNVLLVDGGHTQEAARKDLQMLRAVAAPGHRIVVDDINMEPGLGLRRLEKQREIHLLETYYFGKRTEHNPCQRKPKGRSYPCAGWGFAVGEYMGKI